MKRRFAFNEYNLLILFRALEFEFSYYTNRKHRDLNKAAEAYTMAQRIVLHKPGRIGGHWVTSSTDLAMGQVMGLGRYERKDLCMRKKDMREWRARLQAAFQESLRQELRSQFLRPAT